VTTNSAALILKIRYQVKDFSSVAFTDDEVDTQITAGFGYVSYGLADESTASAFQTALTQLYASAQLSYSLARDRSKLVKWKSSLGEEVNQEAEAKALIAVGDAWMAQVKDALDRQLKMKSDSVQMVDQAKGALFNFNANVPCFSDYKPSGTVGRLGRPSDR